jgi:hypothetical protein
MRFFAKLIFICNGCFVLAAILRLVENARKKQGSFDGLVQLQPLESTIVVLGYTAIIFNFIFNAIVLVLLLLKKKPAVASWLIWLNFLFLLAQVYYFFISN